jgi:predicted DNA-binding transcriptional regulator YafY
LSGGNRTFRLDRVISADEVLESFGASTQSQDSQTQPGFAATVRISARKRDISERLKTDLPFVAGKDNVQIRSFSPDWAVREIMSFGGAAEIVEPHLLRQQILERATRALSAYN